MRFIRTEDWRPSGINDLEPAAWNALRHAGSACVVAGPGAGKTEFLACGTAWKIDPLMECAPRGGQNQAAVLTVCRAC